MRRFDKQPCHTTADSARCRARWLQHGVGQALALLVLPTAVHAAGFEIPDNGARSVSRGNAFTVRADDATALAHNPGGLTRQNGLRLLYSHNVVHAPSSFTRAKTQIPHGASPAGTDPLRTVENQTPWFALGGMAVVATDFGLADWAFAAGVYGPSAAGHQEWPISGGQRYMLTELDVLLVYYSAAVAYGKKDHFGVGVTLQAAHQPKTQLSLVVDGATGGDLAPYYSPTDVEAQISLAAPIVPTAIVGGWWRPIPQLEFAIAGRVIPVSLHATGDVALRNTPTGSQFTAAQLEVEGSAARLNLVLPPTARAGVRYRGLQGTVERWDLELDVVYEAWSMLKEYKVELDGTIKLFAANVAPDVIIAKNWRDTVSVRLGGTWRLPGDAMALSGGGYYESGAVPNNYSHVDFPAFDRIGLGAGIERKVGPVDLTLAYSHVFQEKRVVSEKFGKVFQQRPISPCPETCTGPGGVKYDGVPANAGVFESSFNMLSLSAGYSF